MVNTIEDKIIKISDKILNLLLEFREKNPDFTFSLRQRDSVRSKDKRLENGFWFQGSNYIYVPLFKKGDNARKLKTVGFVIGFSKDGENHNNYIEISFKVGSNDNEKAFHKELADYFNIELDKNNVGYYKFSSNDYENNINFYLNDFRNKALELLDKYSIKSQFVITEDQFKKALTKINTIRENLKNSSSQEKMNAIEPDIIQRNNMKLPLNQILYGPPGTGKTYHTINKALSIIENKSQKEIDGENRDVLKRRFENYLEWGQVVFTTFHQSMSYEDFIEGIKPHKTDDNDVYYDVDKGLFRNICEKASEKKVKSNNFSEVYSKLLQEIDGAPESKLVLETLSQAKEFTIYKNSKGNIRFHANTENAYEGVIKKEILEHYLRTGEALDWPSYTKSISKYIVDKYSYSQAEENVSKRFVLIIDEINRGNVSQVFGELITLIEESKRLGNPEELNVTLPYSKKEFGVPSNLYIIGTMNTADRSVEALDTALRRRFSFVEMMPIPEVVEKTGFTDFPRVQIMQKINQRIELLLDKNHTLGHSYFMKENFQASFKNEIIPLLQEYFYNDSGKIGLILGKGFVREKEISKANQQNIFADFETRNEFEIVKSYELIPFEDEVFDFEMALQTLLS